MWKLITLSVFQSLLLTAGQVFLKFAMAKMPSVSRSFSWEGLGRTVVQYLVNWQFAACGLCFLFASLLWMYILKVFPLSVAYPMVSLSYVFGLFAAMLFFHETVSLRMWIGVLMIVLGCGLIAK